MNRSAVLHIPMSQYAFAKAEDVFTIRIRTAKGDLDSCTLFYGDRACMQSPVVFLQTDMKVCWQDEYYDYYETTITPSPKRICYYFKLVKETEWIYLGVTYRKRMSNPSEADELKIRIKGYINDIQYLDTVQTMRAFRKDEEIDDSDYMYDLKI